MALKAGSLKEPRKTEYEDSLAEAIEYAFKQEWSNAMGDMELPETSPQMQLLFVAVAQGIVGYLKKNAGSFEITFDTADLHTHTVKCQVKTTGTLHAQDGST